MKVDSICITDNDCAPTYYCYLKSSICAPCQDCSPYHRQPSHKVCAKEVGDCGPCITGYKAEEIFNRENHEADYCSEIETTSPTTGEGHLLVIVVAVSFVCFILLLILISLYYFYVKGREYFAVQEKASAIFKNKISDVLPVSSNVSDERERVSPQSRRVSEEREIVLPLSRRVSEEREIVLPPSRKVSEERDRALIRRISEDRLRDTDISTLKPFLKFCAGTSTENVLGSVPFIQPNYERQDRNLHTLRNSFPDSFGRPRENNYTLRNDNTTQDINDRRSGDFTNSGGSSGSYHLLRNNTSTENNSSQEIDPLIQRTGSSAHSIESSDNESSRGPNFRRTESESANSRECFGNTCHTENVGIQENTGDNSVLCQDNSSNIHQHTSIITDNRKFIINNN